MIVIIHDERHTCKDVVEQALSKTNLAELVRGVG